MYLVRKTYENFPEFLKSAVYQTISCTVSDEGIEADEQGRRLVPAGSFLDAGGKVVTAAEGEMVGILFDTVDVTYGPQPGALLIDGAVDTERLPDIQAVDSVQNLIVKMPYIKFFIEGRLQIAGASKNGTSSLEIEASEIEMQDVISSEKSK